MVGSILDQELHHLWVVDSRRNMKWSPTVPITFIDICIQRQQKLSDINVPRTSNLVEHCLPVLVRCVDVRSVVHKAEGMTINRVDVTNQDESMQNGLGWRLFQVSSIFLPTQMILVETYLSYFIQFNVC